MCVCAATCFAGYNFVAIPSMSSPVSVHMRSGGAMRAPGTGVKGVNVPSAVFVCTLFMMQLALLLTVVGRVSPMWSSAFLCLRCPCKIWSSLSPFWKLLRWRRPLSVLTKFRLWRARCRSWMVKLLVPSQCLLVNSQRNWLAPKSCVSNFLPTLMLVFAPNWQSCRVELERVSESVPDSVTRLNSCSDCASCLSTCCH